MCATMPSKSELFTNLQMCLNSDLPIYLCLGLPSVDTGEVGVGESSAYHLGRQADLCLDPCCMANKRLLRALTSLCFSFSYTNWEY
jgi:hypothetical protein